MSVLLRSGWVFCFLAAVYAPSWRGANAQNASATAVPSADQGHKETPEDEPFEGVPRGVETTPRSIVTVGPYRSVQVNVNNVGLNIVGDAANEPSIAIDPNDPDHIAIGWRQFDSVQSNFRQAGWGYSLDGGETWIFPGVLQPGIFRSDPVLDFDADGRFYYNSLTSDFLCQFFISDNGGQTWSAAINAFGGDKNWCTIDRTNGIGRGNIYCAWSPAAGCCGNRLFTRSTDGGLNFMEPMELPASPMWGTLAVAPNGDLFICSRSANGSVQVQRSTNAKNPGAVPVFSLVVDVDIGGVTRFSMQPNPGGLLGQTWIACEPPGGPRPDNVYLLASVDPPGSDAMDVMFTRSTDGGLTWEPPRRINDDPADSGAIQWFGTMAVAPDGRIDAVWNDTRVHPSNTISELHFATSDDGGVTWSANVAVSPPFDPSLGYPNQNKLGDYYHMISTESFAYVAYAATFTGGQDVYLLRIPIDCNANGVDDDLDIAGGTSLDCNANSVPDECDRDCDGSGAVDACEIAAGTAFDCDANAIIDSCDIVAGRLADCNQSGVPDLCELVAGTVPDCNANSVPDSCDIAAGFAADCNANGVPDACDSVDLALLIAAPADTAACTGASAQFSVSAPGATGYQWRFAGIVIPGALDANLTVDPVIPAAEGAYTCVVSFGCVSAESQPGELRVMPPQVSAELATLEHVSTCTQGGDAAYAVRVQLDDADGALYQWSHAGVDLVDDGRISGAQSPLLNVAHLQPGDEGAYTCRAWNTCMDPADADAVTATLEFIDPVFLAEPTHACAELGTTAVFTGLADASSPFIYRWYEGATQLQDGGRFSGATTDTLQLANVGPADLGRSFRLRAIVASPLCSRYSEPAFVLVQSPGGCGNCPHPGDFDGDGDYDLLDATRFTGCFGANVSLEAECACANVAGADVVIDNADWEMLELLLTGPKAP